jgi:heme-degrading monooxygenase HmoA
VPLVSRREARRLAVAERFALRYSGQPPQPRIGTPMILALSRFRVANGKEAEVRAAFEARPRLVERAPGFLGLEVFTDTHDPATFWLLTRWTDEERFREWHRGPDHRASHAHIPKGLKLDPDVTLITTLERIEGAS